MIPERTTLLLHTFVAVLPFRLFVYVVAHRLTVVLCVCVCVCACRNVEGVVEVSRLTKHSHSLEALKYYSKTWCHRNVTSGWIWVSSTESHTRPSFIYTNYVRFVRFHHQFLLQPMALWGQPNWIQLINYYAGLGSQTSVWVLAELLTCPFSVLQTHRTPGFGAVLLHAPLRHQRHQKMF